MSTLQALVVFAAETEHSDKTLFYVLGGFAAVYAVVVSAIGITQPDFPRSQGAAKAVYAVSTLVVAAAIASALITN